MALITAEDMVVRFGEKELAERTDHENYEVINEDVLAKAMTDAEEEAGAYLRAAKLSYGADGNPPPPVLVIKVCDIARYYLYQDAVTQIIEDRYKSAVSWLKSVVSNPGLLDPTRYDTADKPSTCAVAPNEAPDLREWL
ncbi:phage protein Gp36 family protein [Neisseria yangbaofengii]|uniref:phage protein Gp36 family protein n=1 Tax=Neisseria yangbaofengii TaxID=2709396 RepID=UPI001D00CEB1|nr:phage protein Gp36 family protein [Neisseria yangbaofengii]